MDNSFFKELEILGSENSVDTSVLVEKVSQLCLKLQRELIRTVRIISE